MGRRKDEPGLIEFAVKSEWWVSAALAAGFLFGGLVVAPSIARGNLLLSTLIPIARWVGVLGALLFGIIALTRYAQTKLQRPADTSPAWSPTAPRRSTVARREPIAGRAFDAPVDARPVLTPAPRAVAVKPASWSLELLQSLDWKRFEDVVAAYFREKGFRCETIAFGPDGGVDGRLYFGDLEQPVGIVQCKAWARQVGVAPVRELLGVMAHEKVKRGYFATTGTFSDDAIRFAAANPMMLIDGNDFLTAIAKMDDDRREKLLALSTEGDYTTPSCPSCGIKLERKSFRNGSNAWVCKRYPACKTKIFAKAA